MFHLLFYSSIILFIPHVIVITFLFGEIIIVSRTYCLRTTGGSYVLVPAISDRMNCTYRAKVAKKYIASIDARKRIPTINILKAMSLLVEAWDRVTAITVMNCFRKSGISTESQQQSLNDADDSFKALASDMEELRARYERLIPSEMAADDESLNRSSRIS